MPIIRTLTVIAASLVGLASAASAQDWPNDSEGFSNDPAFGESGSFRPYAFSPSYGTGGVDVTTGRAGGGQALLSIGAPGAGGLVYAREFSDPRGSYDNFSSAVEVREGEGSDPDTVVVTALGMTYQFEVDGGSYEPLYGTGATLTKSSSYWTLTGRHGTVYEFRISLGSGAPIYAPDGRLTRVKYPNGSDLSLHYQERALCTQRRIVSAPSSCVSTFKTHRLVSVESSFGYQIAYEYAATAQEDDVDDGSHTRIVKVVAVNNRYDACPRDGAACTGLSRTYPEVTFASPSWGRSVVVTNAEGEVARYRYDSVGRFTGVDHGDPSREDAVYSYKEGRVSSATIAGETWSYAYADADGVRTATVTDPASNEWVTKTRIDPRQVIESRNPLGDATTYDYFTSGASDGLVKKITSPVGSTTEYTYDARGNVTQIKRSPAGGGTPITTSATYPGSCTASTRLTCNKPKTTRSALERDITYSYSDTHGGVRSVTYPSTSGQAAQVQQVTYQSHQARYEKPDGGLRNSQRAIWLPETESFGGLATSYGYDTSGTRNLNRTQARTVANDGSVDQTITYEHDHVGNTTNIDGPFAGQPDEVRVEYDRMRRPVLTVGLDPDGAGPAGRQATKTYYDEAGRPERTETGSVGSLNSSYVTVLEQQVNEYDDYGRLRQQRFVAGGQVRAATDYLYDHAGRLYCTVQRMQMPANQPVTSCTAGSLGMTYGQHRVQRRYYDDASRVSIVASGYGTDVERTEKMGYHPNGQIAWLIDGENNRTDYQIDGFGRVERTDYPGSTGYEQTYYQAGTGLVDKVRRRDSSIVDYGYDGLGRVTGANYPGSSDDLTITYDARHRRRTMSSRGRTLTFAYDDAGRLVSETSPMGTVSYDYDGIGRRERIDYPGSDGFHVTYEYENAGPLKRIKQGGSNDVLATFSYDQLGRRTALERGNGTITYYDFNAASEFEALAFELPNHAGYDRTVSFERNPAGQIAKATDDNASYNSVVTLEDVQATFGAANRMMDFDGQTTSYDDRGNLTSDGTNAYAYTTLNQLSRVNGSEIEMAYDPAGRLFEEVVNGSSTQMSYDGASLIAEYDSSGNVLRRYVHGPGVDEPIVWYEGSGTTNRRYLTADERGSIVLVTRNNGRVTRRNYYDENGVPSSDNLGRFGYTGQTRIGGEGKWQLGLWHYKARAYAARQGRFLQSDPIGYADGLNTYAYVGGDPVNMRDPMGLTGEGEEGCDQNGENCGVDEIVVTGTRISSDSPMVPFLGIGIVGIASPGNFLPNGTSDESDSDDCPGVPPAPPGVDVDRNMSEARNAQRNQNIPDLPKVDAWWFYNQVRNGGPWDFKQQSPAGPISANPTWSYQEFGNFNYGATGSAHGFSMGTLLQLAGIAQRRAGTSDPSWGSVGFPFVPQTGSGFFGDDPADARQVIMGVQYAENGCDQ